MFDLQIWYDLKFKINITNVFLRKRTVLQQITDNINKSKQFQVQSINLKTYLKHKYI